MDGVTSAIQTQLDNKIPYESVGSTRKDKLYGINLFSSETFVNPSIGYVSPLHIDITNIQGNSYIENTVVIPYLRNPNAMWVEGDLHLVSANVHANNKIVSPDKISYLSNVTYDIQSQLNKCQPKFVALDPLEQIMENVVVGNEILGNHFLGLSQTFLNTVDGKQDLLNKCRNITFNVGRGNVYLENNANDNVNGSGLTLRTSSNPGNGGGNIFGVRSSDQICRLWVGNEITTPGENSFYCGYAGVTGSESNKANYRHSFTNTSVILGTPVTCQYDLSCSTFTAASIYGGAAIQILNHIDGK